MSEKARNSSSTSNERQKRERSRSSSSTGIRYGFTESCTVAHAQPPDAAADEHARHKEPRRQRDAVDEARGTKVDEHEDGRDGHEAVLHLAGLPADLVGLRREVFVLGLGLAVLIAALLWYH